MTFSDYHMQAMQTSTVMDVLLSDICIGTSAAPTFLPGYYFKNQYQHGNSAEFNLIDGGLAANNPVHKIYFLRANCTNICGLAK